jgi:hypothetical protein
VSVAGAAAVATKSSAFLCTPRVRLANCHPEQPCTKNPSQLTFVFILHAALPLCPVDHNCVSNLCSPCPVYQVANYLDFTAEDTDEDKKRALAEVVGLGDTAWVKVGGRRGGGGGGGGGGGAGA